MPRKPPLLAAMDGDPPPEDRRKVYDRRMRDGGNVKVTLWVPADVSDDVRDALRLLLDETAPVGLKHNVREHLGAAGAVWRLSRL